LSRVHIRAYAATPPSYATVLDLNRELEAFPPFDAPPYQPSPGNTPDADALLQRHMSKTVKQEGEFHCP
jgi:hypothetical protein